MHNDVDSIWEVVTGSKIWSTSGKKERGKVGKGDVEEMGRGDEDGEDREKIRLGPGVKGSRILS